MQLQLLTIRLGKLMMAIRSFRFLNALIYHRVLAATEHRPVFSMADFKLVVDIGANRGQFSLAARQWAPRAKIHAFEPLAGPATLFRRVFRDDKTVSLHQTAIGSQTGQTTMHVSESDDSSSLLPISDAQVRLFPGTGEVRTEEIKVATLTDFLTEKDISANAPALLKLDVQGFELEALSGCEALLNCFTVIYVECSFVELYKGQALADEVIAWLRERGFQLQGIYNTGYDQNGRAIQGDFLFAKRR